MNPYFANEMESFTVASALDHAAREVALESKRVRFQEEPWYSDETGSEGSSENEDDLLNPFMQQDQLDPEFRSLIENDEDEDEDEDSSVATNEGDGHWDERESGPVVTGNSPLIGDGSFESIDYSSDERASKSLNFRGLDAILGSPLSVSG